MVLKVRDPVHQLLKQQILNAVATVLEQRNIPSDEPLEYYVDDIMLRTLENCATYFFKNGPLRASEKKTLTELQSDIKANVDLTHIEERLINNLTNITPTWGEFFGTDRGLVYKTFKAFKEWPCFSWHARRYYKEQREHQLNKQHALLSKKIAQQNGQLSDASQLLQRHESTSDALTQRTASQFITIQQLRMELSAIQKTVQQPKNVEIRFDVGF